VARTLEYDIVIIGAGPAGLTAALYAGRSMLRAVALEKGAPGGELLNTEKVEDYPGFQSVDGWELAQKFEEHAKKFGVEIATGVNVVALRRLHDGTFETVSDTGDMYRSPAVILTSGGTPVKLGVPGELEFAGKGVSYCAVCDGHFFRGHTIAVVGGGDAACEEADFLTRYADKVYLIHRRHEFRASKIIQKRVAENRKIEVIWNTLVDRVDGDAQGLMRSVALRDAITGEKRDLAATGLFVFIGFKPNTGILQEHVEHDASGYIVTDQNMASSLPGLFVAGDVRAQLTRQVTTAAGDATTATIAAEKYLATRRDHERAAAAVHGAAAVAR
jgi:thioredoxin reductase (NADPH)